MLLLISFKIVGKANNPNRGIEIANNKYTKHIIAITFFSFSLAGIIVETFCLFFNLNGGFKIYALNAYQISK